MGAISKYSTLLEEVRQMEKAGIAYPIPKKFMKEKEIQMTQQVIFKSIVASLCGASVPAIIFYFLM